MKEKLKIICRIILLFIILCPIFSFAQNMDNELIGKLKMPGVLRDCPSTNCKIIGYYAEETNLRIIGVDGSKEWYKIIAPDLGFNPDPSGELNGWMHYSLFMQDFRNSFSITSVSTSKPQELNDSDNHAQFLLGSKDSFLSKLNSAINPQEQDGLNSHSKRSSILNIHSEIPSQYFLILFIIFIILICYIVLFAKRGKRFNQPKIPSLDIERSYVIKNKTSIVIIIACLICFISGGFVLANNYSKISQLLEEVDVMIQNKNFDQAIESLNDIENQWVVKYLGAKRAHVMNNKSRIEQEKRIAADEELALAKAEQETKIITELEQRIKELEGSPKNIIKEISPFITKSQEISAQEIDPYLTSIVKIDCKNQEGSGALWKIGSDNYILTNYHVVSSPYPSGHCNVVIHEKNSPDAVGLYEIYLSTGKRWNSYTDISLLKISMLYIEGMSWLPIQNLNYNLSFLRKCPTQMSLGSPVIVIGYPAFSLTSVMWEGKKLGEQTVRTVTNGIISSYDSSEVQPFGSLPYPNYFVSAKIDSGNSGGIAFSKDSNGLCLLGVPTWISLGRYETQGIIQNIHNVMYTE